MITLTTTLAAAACLISTISAQNSTGNDGNITSDTYFYGQSPSVLPSRTLRYPFIQSHLTLCS